MNGIAGLYGGYAPTLRQQAELEDRRHNPFLWLATGSGYPASTGGSEDYPTAPPNGYADGGTVQLGIAGAVPPAYSAMPATLTLIDILREVARKRNPDVMTGGASGSADTQGSAVGAPADAAGTHGKLSGAASFAAGMIPGGGLVTGIGNAFNGAASALMAQGVNDQMSGMTSGFGAKLGAGISGALGSVTGGLLGPQAGVASMEDATDPGVAGAARAMQKSALDRAIAQAEAPSADMVSAMNFANGAGFGIAGLAGPAATGVNTGANTAMGQSMGVSPASALAMGQPQSNPNPTNLAMGNDGVVGMNVGDPVGNNFGGMATGNQATANSNSEGSQGGNGNGQGGGGSSGGGSGGGAGANGGGGDNAGGWARGGKVGNRFARGSGLVRGSSGGRSDRLAMEVPQGSFVVPADVVSGLGEGNTDAGARRLAGMIPAGARPYANGGIVGRIPEVPIQISPGEFVVHPAHVDAMGGSDALDQLVAQVRQANALTAQTMPPPR